MRTLDSLAIGQSDPYLVDDAGLVYFGPDILDGDLVSGDGGGLASEQSSVWVTMRLLVKGLAHVLEPDVCLMLPEHAQSPG